MVARGGAARSSSSPVSTPHPFVEAWPTTPAERLTHMACTIAAELMPHRINVTSSSRAGSTRPRACHIREWTQRESGAGAALGRMGTPADIGKAAVFLCSDDAD